jgi:hypothetical protein
MSASSHHRIERVLAVAERIVRQLIDDIDGTEISDGAGETIDFSLRSAAYRIDLSSANIAKLEKALKPFIDKATRVKAVRSTRAKANGSAGNGADLSAIREWARANGYEVSDRGRIRAEIAEAFAASH